MKQQYLICNADKNTRTSVTISKSLRGWIDLKNRIRRLIFKSQERQKPK